MSVVSYQLRDVTAQTDQPYTFHLIIMTPMGPRSYAIDHLMTGETFENVGVRRIQNAAGEEDTLVVVQFPRSLPYLLSRREDIRIEDEADMMEYQLNQLAQQKVFNERAHGLMKPREEPEEWR